MEKDMFLEGHKGGLETEFLEEYSLSFLIYQIESGYNPKIIKHWGISDLIINKDKVIFKWYKRVVPLSQDRLEKIFGTLPDDIN